jgi:hypothetical protein
MSKEDYAEAAPKRPAYKQRVQREEFFIGAHGQKFKSPDEAARSFKVQDLSQLLTDLAVEEVSDGAVDTDALAAFLIQHFDQMRGIVYAE